MDAKSNRVKVIDTKIIRMTKEKWLETGKALYGEDFLEWEFVCPACGHIQKVKDFKPFKDQGATPDSARYNCIGRYIGGRSWTHGSPVEELCDYTSGGLFNIAPIRVIDGLKEYSCFAFSKTLETLEVK